MTDYEKQGCLALLAGLFLGKQEPIRYETVYEPDYEYRLRDDFLSAAELSLLDALRSAIGERAIICPKVNLRDIFFDPHARGRSAATNKISQRHVDFLLCHPSTMRPLAGIELDDSSHRRDDRKVRDAEVDDVFRSADLRLFRQPVQWSYDIQQLTKQLESVLPSSENSARSPSPQPRTPLGATMVEAPPLCPKCGIPMVVRTVSKGEHQGRKFYGCRNYPQCREMKPLKA